MFSELTSTILVNFVWPVVHGFLPPLFTTASVGHIPNLRDLFTVETMLAD